MAEKKKEKKGKDNNTPFFLGRRERKGRGKEKHTKDVHRQHSTNQRMTKTRILAIDEREWGWAKKCVPNKHHTHTNAYQKSMRVWYGARLTKQHHFGSTKPLPWFFRSGGRESFSRVICKKRAFLS
jgi:hypothetical protein